MRQLKASSAALPTSGGRKNWQPSLTVAIARYRLPATANYVYQNKGVSK
ncbi:hypothetical protein H6G17_31675 [Chroococcidiopsis sp. FACHB-1243]|nr:hypothetical protein [Chroococcidiopsis sp. [FACHB-1243]]MBD2309963.1 hypothetical protein [Chroococcidiopsis sp. [FACHB-1243]]